MLLRINCQRLRQTNKIIDDTVHSQLIFKDENRLAIFMPYITPEVVQKVKRMDLLTYLRNYEPCELVHFSGNTYTTRTHDSLKISNGKWMWWKALIRLVEICQICYTNNNVIRHKDRIGNMNTAEIINNVCSELGVTKADLAKRMGMLPSSLYRKLSQDTMTFKELQKCLEVLGVTIAFDLQYPDGNTQSSQANHELLLEKMELQKTELEVERKAAEFHRKSLRDLRAELSSAIGYVEMGERYGSKAEQYLKRIRSVLSSMELIIAYDLGEEPDDGIAVCEPQDIESLAGKRVLIVDDNDLNREILKEILMDRGLMVEEAGNGNEAVAYVQAKEPGYYNFILMDIEMPMMDGYEATVKIRKLPNRIRANIPIIALTANAVPENRARATVVGMDDFLVKPVNSARLLGSMARFN